MSTVGLVCLVSALTPLNRIRSSFWTVRDLRHTFCTLGRQAGIAPEVMQRLMRHKDIRTTLEIYSHVTDDGAVRAIEGSMLLPDGVTHGREAQTVQ